MDILEMEKQAEKKGNERLLLNIFWDIYIQKRLKGRKMKG